jgi:hypothetical protein
VYGWRPGPLLASNHGGRDTCPVNMAKNRERRSSTPVERRPWRAREGAALGRWTLVGKNPLGRGGNGTVWQARAADDDAQYAIKMFTGGRFDGPARYQRFVDEVTFLRGHRDEGVLPLVDSCACRKLHPRRSSSRSILMEDAAETILSTYREVIDPFGLKSRRQGPRRCRRGK